MDAEDRERFRNALLAQLDRASAMGLAVRTLVIGARTAGFRTADDEAVRRELEYLGDKGLAKKADKTLSPENQRWRITAEGRDYLAVHGLA